VKRLERFDFLADPRRLQRPWASLVLLLAALVAMFWPD
jgi:hypothetical protein